MTQAACAARSVGGTKKASVVLLVTCASALGCQLLGKDSAQCEQSVNTVRQAITFKDFDSARKWRDYTWKVCDERAVVATLDKEITDGEAALAAEAQAKAEQEKKVAQARINAAQTLWLKFDQVTAAQRTREYLDKTHQASKRLEKGLSGAYLDKVRSFNDAEYQKRLAALGR